MSQDDLASRSGIGLRTISDIERGESDPRLGTLESLAEALECAVSDLTRPIGAIGTKTMIHTREAVKSITQNKLAEAASLLTALSGASKVRLAVVCALAFDDASLVLNEAPGLARAVESLIESLE